MHATDIKIAEPCHEDWSKMSKEGARRFCASCSKHVHDLSAMPPAQAEALVEGGGVCVRYRADASGEVLHPGKNRRRRWARSMLSTIGATLVQSSAMAAPMPQDGPSLLERVKQAVVEWVQDDDELELLGTVDIEPIQGKLEVIPEPPPPPPVMGRIAPSERPTEAETELGID